jgi:hypothetical protein
VSTGLPTSVGSNQVSLRITSSEVNHVSGNDEKASVGLHARSFPVGGGQFVPTAISLQTKISNESYY